MKKVILYDLDHTLFDPKTIDKNIFQPAFDILAQTEHSTEHILTEVIDAFFSISLNVFIQRYLTDTSKIAFIQKLRNIDNFPRLATYSDAHIVQQIGTINYLITSGLREFQNQKIDALGIRDWFEEIYIDDPIDPKWKNKEEIMWLIIKKHEYDISEVLVIGDNPESEIKAGNNIGIDTIQILREGIEDSEMASHSIKNLNELHTYIS